MHSKAATKQAHLFLYEVVNVIKV
ncbi:hypothetical protein MNBD_GAMMA26-712, partial [hydrothermal vent metagenome]